MPWAIVPTNDKFISPTRSIINGRETILAGTNNYMGITFEPSCVIEAGQEGAHRIRHGHHGLAHRQRQSYSRHTGELEARNRQVFSTSKHCIVFTTGYQANLGMMAGLAGPQAIRSFLDADSHSSIYDGCTLSGAPSSCASATMMRHDSRQAPVALWRRRRVAGDWWCWKAFTRCSVTAAPLKLILSK